MQNRKWLSVLISVVVSIGLWVYVVTVENPVQELELHNIPVTLSGQDLLREDYDLLITDSNIEGGVSLTFSGKYSDLRKLRENRDQLQLTISVTHLRSAQEYNLPFDMADVTLPSNLSSQDISLSNKDPNVVVVTLEKLGRSTIPVKVAANVTTEEGYTTGSLTQNYDEITVEGPEELVDQISYAQVILERENVAQTVTSTLPFNLINASGEIIENESIVCSVTEIEVSLPVLMYKDVPLVASVIDGGGATSKDCDIDIEPRSVRLSGDPSDLESVNSITLSNISLVSLMTNSEKVERDIVIPDGCKSISGEEKATVTIEIRNKSIKSLGIPSSNFQTTGLPSNMTVHFNTVSLRVTIRADEGDLNNISADNVRVVADFSDSTLGTNMNVPVTIIVDGFEGAGAVGTYTINVDVVSAEDETTNE